LDRQSVPSERRFLVALAVLSLVAVACLMIVLGAATGTTLTTVLLLLPVIALPAISPLIFCAWMFATDTNA
jgi:hypothetical protein